MIFSKLLAYVDIFSYLYIQNEGYEKWNRARPEETY